MKQKVQQKEIIRLIVCEELISISKLEKVQVHMYTEAIIEQERVKKT